MRSVFRRSRRALLAVVVALVVAPVYLVAPAAAAETEVTGGTLDWAISPRVQTLTSLSQSRGAGAPATFAADAWHFSDGVGTYDDATGVLDLDLPGSLEFGNTTQGNYGFRLSAVSVHVDAAGDGRLEADVAVRGPGGQPFAAPATDVTVVEFSAAADIADAGTVTWSVVPDTIDVPDAPAFDGAQQFPQSFLDAVGASFASHFRQTGVAGAEDPTNVSKLPAPLTFSVPHEATPAPTPTVVVDPESDLDPAGETVTITGTGFAEGDQGVYVRLCAAAAGEIGTADGRPGGDRCLGDPQHWVSPTPGGTGQMNDDGSFSVDLDVVGTFTAGETEFDCTEVQCGIATRRDHNGGAADYSLDTFTPISFTEATDPDPTDPTDPGPTDPDPTDPEPVTGDGALDWGVKASFRSYVENGPAAGTIATTDPATRNEDGSFRFDLGSGLDYVDETDLDAPFEGAVRFTGHDGALDLVISDPRVAVDGDAGSLVVDAVSKALDSAESETFDDVVVATLDLTDVTPTADGDQVHFADVPATLTEAGAGAFGGFYDPGEALDPLTMVLAVDDTSGLDPTPEPAADTVGCVPATAVAGATIDVCGEGFTPGEQVQVFLHSEPVFLAVVSADADGAVEAVVTLPADAVGSHRIELRGVTSGRSIFSAEFTVAATPDRIVAARSGSLPVTGNGVEAPVRAGVLFVVLGSMLVIVGHRRRTAVG